MEKVIIQVAAVERCNMAFYCEEHNRNCEESYCDRGICVKETGVAPVQPEFSKLD